VQLGGRPESRGVRVRSIVGSKIWLSSALSSFETRFSERTKYPEFIKKCCTHCTEYAYFLLILIRHLCHLTSQSQSREVKCSQNMLDTNTRYLMLPHQ